MSAKLQTIGASHENYELYHDYYFVPSDGLLWHPLVRILDRYWGKFTPEEQDQIAKVILDMLEPAAEPYVLSKAERDAIERSREASRCSEFASDEQVRAVLAKYSQ